jgi:DNA repair ATPase RecN
MLHKIGLLLLVGAISTSTLGAQDPPRREGQGPGRGARANAPLMSPGEVINMLDAYAVVQAQEALQLTEAQYGPFVTRLKKLHETRRRGQQGRNRILRDLRQLAGPQAPAPDENALRTNLKALREHDARTAEETSKAYDAVDEVLDVRQQARFRLFEERLEARKIDLLMRARQGAARGGGQ